ncbi:MAG: PASTA domain-containing protein, partial [Pseudomonadota bacterium]
MDKSRKTVSQVVARSSSLFALFGALVALALPAISGAQSIIATDCFGGLKNVFQDNEPVCATGTTGGSFLGPPAAACIVPPGAAPTNGNDVTFGGCNAIPFGNFFDEFLWLPNPRLTVGTYEMVLLNNQGFESFRDTIVVVDSGGAAPTVDVQAIKDGAEPNIGTWQELENFGNYIDDAASVISLAYAAATGDVLGAAVAAGGLVTGQPTDYNGAVLSIGGQIIASLSSQQRLYYTTLFNDPPDPNFTDIFPLDLGLINDGLAGQAPLNPGIPLEYPFENLSNDSLHLETIALANSMAEEAALVFSLTRTLEKYQGADEADDDEFILVQARALKMYADQLSTQLATTRQGLLNYQAELVADGVADVEYDAAEIAAIVDRLTTSGLTPEEEQDLRDSGFGDADIQLIFDRIAALPVPTGTYTRNASIDAIIASNDVMSASVQVLSDEAQDVIDFFEPMVTEQHPTAVAGGPYADIAGATINFDGSGSSDPQAQALTFEWDFNLDGVFDDAVGASASNSYAAPAVTQVGLKVTDTDGNESISYATVTITEANAAPQITAFAPLDLSPTASNLNPLDFSADATDADMDPLVYEWAVDGAVVSNNQAFTFTPGAGETGTRAVRLTVSDLNPLSIDAVETRVVLLLDEVQVPDVVGLEQSLAEDAIVAADLTVGMVTTMNSATVPAGDVISQNPVGDTIVLAGSEVDLVVSTGPDDVTVPDVTGLAQALAESDILAAGLSVGAVTTANSDTVPAGAVISQDPIGGTLVQPGTAVDLVVSIGPADVIVPDVTGLPQATAESNIIAANLTVGTVTTANSDTVPAGAVISQDPQGGAMVQPGTPVDLVVSTGPADVAVPNVVGLPQADAEEDIVAANLTVGAITTASSDTVPAGTVISQAPVSGNLVPPGTPVDLVVSTGPADIAVPDVVGLQQATAEAVIVKAGLTVGNITTEESDTVPAGTVVGQEPGAGNLVQPGSPVDLIVSVGPAGSPPDAPTGLSARTKQLLVNLFWQPSEGATSYVVFRRLNTETEFVEVGSSQFIIFSNKLLDDTMFADYYVVARNEFGDSEPSETLRVAPVFRDRP